MRDNALMGVTDVNDKDRPMPPLIAFAGALGGLAVVRWAYKTAVRINRELEEARMARVAEHGLAAGRAAPGIRLGCGPVRRGAGPTAAYGEQAEHEQADADPGRHRAGARRTPTGRSARSRAG